MVEVVPTDRNLRPTARVLLLIGGVGLAGLLLTARLLQPSSDGFGTHRQLGMPACSLVAILGVRCPSCGMTTSWAHLTRGQLPAAMRANTGGAMLALVAMLAAPWLIVSATIGRWWLGKPAAWVVVVTAVTIVGTALVQWTWRLVAD